MIVPVASLVAIMDHMNFYVTNCGKRADLCLTRSRLFLSVVSPMTRRKFGLKSSFTIVTEEADDAKRPCQYRVDMDVMYDILKHFSASSPLRFVFSNDQLHMSPANNGDDDTKSMTAPICGGDSGSTTTAAATTTTATTAAAATDISSSISISSRSSGGSDSSKSRGSGSGSIGTINKITFQFGVAILNYVYNLCIMPKLSISIVPPNASHPKNFVATITTSGIYGSISISQTGVNFIRCDAPATTVSISDVDPRVLRLLAPWLVADKLFISIFDDHIEFIFHTLDAILYVDMFK